MVSGNRCKDLTMSCYDEIICEMSLPGDVPDFIQKRPVFQTYNLGCKMNVFLLKDGQLQLDINHCFIAQVLKEALELPEEQLPSTSIDYKRKRIVMYASNVRGGKPGKKGYQWYTDDGSDKIDITYVVQIRNSRVSSIKELSRTVEPALPYKDF